MAFGQSGSNRAEVVVFKKGVVFAQNGCNWVKVVVFGQSGCIREKVVVFEQKLLHLGKSGCIRAK